jgi:hypothetical protein
MARESPGSPVATGSQAGPAGRGRRLPDGGGAPGHPGGRRPRRERVSGGAPGRGGGRPGRGCVGSTRRGALLREGSPRRRPGHRRLRHEPGDACPSRSASAPVQLSGGHRGRRRVWHPHGDGRRRRAHQHARGPGLERLLPTFVASEGRVGGRERSALRERGRLHRAHQRRHPPQGRGPGLSLGRRRDVRTDPGPSQAGRSGRELRGSRKGPCDARGCPGPDARVLQPRGPAWPGSRLPQGIQVPAPAHPAALRCPRLQYPELHLWRLHAGRALGAGDG